MKKAILAASAALVICILACTINFSKFFFQQNKNNAIAKMPAPQEGEENEKLRELYNELRHQAAPGDEWKEIEKQNAIQAGLAKLANTNRLSFANGNITGTWAEKGANNLAGSVRSVDYNPAANTIYTISNGGSVWSSVLASGVWTLRNQSQRFEQRAIKAFTKTGGGERLLVASGAAVYYSDNNGQTVIPATGITFPVAWGGNYVAGFYRLNDGSNTIYCLVRLLSDVPFAPRFRLYRSVTEGQSYVQIYQFDTGDDDKVSVCIPYNSNNLYIADIGSLASNIKLFSVTGGTVSLVNTFAAGITLNNGVLKGTFLSGINNLYLMLNNNALYSSTNFGAAWALKSSLPENAWGKMNVSMSDAAKVSFGGVNAFRSTNGGTSFVRVNDWSEYYGNPSGKLHADIMEIEYFRKTDNTEFAIINCHGGTFISYDNLVTVNNISLNSLVAVEYYDVLTDTINQNRIFAGSQDQGAQRTLTGSTTGSQNFSQIISGDYGQLSLTNNNNFLWPQYPGGTYYLFTGLGNSSPSYIGQWSTPGTQKPNYGWMLAATATAVGSANEIWLGGGNLTGGSGSYLIKATLPLVSPYTVSATQFNYDFRANSRTTTAGITAIEQSLLNPNKLFVATEDGTFFYSTDLGATWNKTNSFTGPYPWYLYGSCILASRLNSNTIWYSGSGYSNPGVYKSVDGGVSFAPMSNGLPATLVNEIVATPDERLIFAATEAGPYVYIAGENVWYSLADNTMPTQFFSGVEYIRTQNTVRFATMGRGIWDFKITSGASLPLLLTKWQAARQSSEVICSWQTEQEINTSHFLIERSGDGINFSHIATVPASGNSNTPKNYSYLDKFPLKGINCYRLKTVDIDSKSSFSKIIAIRMDAIVKRLTVYPTPVQNVLYVEINTAVKDDVIVSVTDLTGKLLSKQIKTVNGHLAFSLDASSLAKGVYFISIKGKSINEVQKFIKQ